MELNASPNFVPEIKQFIDAFLGGCGYNVDDDWTIDSITTIYEVIFGDRVAENVYDKSGVYQFLSKFNIDVFETQDMGLIIKKKSSNLTLDELREMFK